MPCVTVNVMIGSPGRTAPTRLTLLSLLLRGCNARDDRSAGPRTGRTAASATSLQLKQRHSTNSTALVHCHTFLALVTFIALVIINQPEWILYIGYPIWYMMVYKRVREESVICDNGLMQGYGIHSALGDSVSPYTIIIMYNTVDMVRVPLSTAAAAVCYIWYLQRGIGS